MINENIEKSSEMQQEKKPSRRAKK
jgi:hypothetical protein